MDAAPVAHQGPAGPPSTVSASQRERVFHGDWLRGSQRTTTGAGLAIQAIWSAGILLGLRWSPGRKPQHRRRWFRLAPDRRWGLRKPGSDGGVGEWPGFSRWLP